MRVHNLMVKKENNGNLLKKYIKFSFRLSALRCWPFSGFSSEGKKHRDDEEGELRLLSLFRVIPNANECKFQISFLLPCRRRKEGNFYFIYSIALGWEEESIF